MACSTFKVLCLLMGASTASDAPPTVPTLQAAYEREATGADVLHDRDLKILGIDCQADGSARFFCQVGFKKTSEPSDRVYLDAALVERRSDGDFKLLRGLCKRLL